MWRLEQKVINFLTRIEAINPIPSYCCKLSRVPKGLFHWFISSEVFCHLMFGFDCEFFIIDVSPGAFRCLWFSEVQNVFWIQKQASKDSRKLVNGSGIGE